MFKSYHSLNYCRADHESKWFNISYIIHIFRTSKQKYYCNRRCQMRPHFCYARAVVLVYKRQNLHWKLCKDPHWYLVRSRLKKDKTLLEIVLLWLWGKVDCVYTSRLRPNPYLISRVTRAHVGTFYLNFLLLICIRIKYFFSLYITRSWCFVCESRFLVILYWC